MQRMLSSSEQPLSNKKGGKVMLAAAKFDPTIPVPERVVDIDNSQSNCRSDASLLAESPPWRFRPGGKESRKVFHELAIVFNEARG